MCNLRRSYLAVVLEERFRLHGPCPAADFQCARPAWTCHLPRSSRKLLQRLLKWRRRRRRLITVMMMTTHPHRPKRPSLPSNKPVLSGDMPVTNDSKERIKRLLTLAMDKKHPISQYLLAKEGLDGNLKGAPTKWLIKAAEGGLPSCHDGIGRPVPYGGLRR